MVDAANASAAVEVLLSLPSAADAVCNVGEFCQVRLCHVKCAAGAQCIEEGTHGQGYQ